MIIINGRNTVQKTMILQTVRSMTNHPSADEIYGKVALRCPGISCATVYRDLGRLADEDKILRVAVANAPDRFDFNTECHAHCHCSVCGRVFDYRLKTEPELDDNGNFGFSSENFYIVVNGICRECAGNTHKAGK